MKIRIDDTIYEGTGAEILEQLRLAAFDPTEFPDTESYLWQLRSNFIRMTDRDCVLPEHGLEETPRWWDQSHWRIMNFCSAAICGAPEWPPSLPGRGAQYTACCGTSRQSVSAPWIIMRVTLTCMGRSR